MENRKIVRYDFRGARSDGSGQNITISWKGYHSKVAEGHFTRTFMVRTVEILFLLFWAPCVRIKKYRPMKLNEMMGNQDTIRQLKVSVFICYVH